MGVAKAAAGSRRDDDHPAPPPSDDGTPSKRAKVADDEKPAKPLSETIVRPSLLSAESRAELRDQFANNKVSLVVLLKPTAFLSGEPLLASSGRAI